MGSNANAALFPISITSPARGDIGTSWNTDRHDSIWNQQVSPASGDEMDDFFLGRSHEVSNQ